MKPKLVYAYLASTLLVLTACAPAPAPPSEPEDTSEADIAAIRQLGQDFADSINSDNMEQQLAVFADDAIRLPPNAPARIGIDVIRATQEVVYGTLNQEFTHSDEEIEVMGDWAFVRGTYTYSATVKKGTDGVAVEPNIGKYLVIFQRQPDGQWKQSRAMWNTDVFMTPPAE